MNKEINSIGFNKKPSDTTVVVAMSGGVDSSTVAGIMKKEGYNVIGITLKLYDDGKEVAASKQCCSGQDIMDAKRVAHKLGIEHKILYYQDKFKQGVIDNFVESYLKGETPIPCVQCNQTVKFKNTLGINIKAKNYLFYYSTIVTLLGVLLFPLAISEVQIINNFKNIISWNYFLLIHLYFIVLFFILKKIK